MRANDAFDEIRRLEYKNMYRNYPLNQYAAWHQAMRKLVGEKSYEEQIRVRRSIPHQARQAMRNGADPEQVLAVYQLIFG